MTLPAYAMGRASFPEMYERFLAGPLFRPWVDPLLERAGVSPGQRVLDLACGTGVVARAAKARAGAGRVVGLDVSAGMLEVAARHAPTVEWREGDACRLPFGAEERFDVLVCQQGFQFFADKPAAAREMRRVLAPGGRAVVATWVLLEALPCFLALHAEGERHLGPVRDQRYSLPAAELEQHLSEAGFGDVRVETLRKTLRLEDPATFLRMNAMAIVGMSGKQLGEAERERLVAAIAEDGARAAAPWIEDGRLVFELATNVATAVA
jgi:ubiquinone/menaquinone biosynthesis C-methylase UbiE